MSGPFGSSQWMYASGGFYPYQIEQSLRFNDDDSAYLSRTPASAGNRRTWTFSTWIKRCRVGASQGIFGKFVSGDSDSGTLLFNGDQLQFSAGTTFLKTTQVFRDTSAWYHVVLTLDTTNATADNRSRLYINGTEVTAFVTRNNPSLNAELGINRAEIHAIGRDQFGGGTNYYDGYLAEVNFIDGTALDPTSFGEFKSGIWVPKAYSGSYGTNGFYLSFADSAAIGDDLSGNGNDWTANNLVATDVLLDSPTNNFAVINPLIPNSISSTSDGNRKVTHTSGTSVRPCTLFSTGGKFYSEIVIEATGTWFGYNGVVPADDAAAPDWNIGASDQQDGYIWVSNGDLRHNTGTTSVTPTYANGDVLMVGLDLDNGWLFFGKNGSWLKTDGTTHTDLTNSANAWATDLLTVSDAGWTFAPGASHASGTTSETIRIGADEWAYTPPADFLPLSTANLPDPVIDPAQDDVPADYFNTVLYTGNGSTQSITGVGFQPDFLWGKKRNSATFGSHQFVDVVRGTDKYVFSDSTNAETTDANRLTSFDSDGFSLGTASQLNGSGDTFVAWNWKAAGAGVANTDGTISSTVSANQKAGFSIVSYTGTGANATVGHGLSAAPKFLIVRNRDTVYNWRVWATPLTGDQLLYLNTTDSTQTLAAMWNSTTPTASVFSLGTNGGVNASGDAFIAYCFAEVEGYSKFGSYTGNGSADGPFVWCGFRPAFVMIKNSSAASQWVMIDTSRDTYNVTDARLRANTSEAETTETFFDVLSNGFKVRALGTDKNDSGNTYIFMAFAEQPAKYLNAR